MVITDQQDRVKWLLGRYPDISPAEVREITTFLKKSPALDIALFEMDAEVKPKVGRFKQDQVRDFGIGPKQWMWIGIVTLVVLVAGFFLWDFGANH